MIILEEKGKLSVGYYNDMEADRPVFIDGESLSTIVKDLLSKKGLDSDFCFVDSPDECHNPLVGKRVKLTLEIEDE